MSSTAAVHQHALRPRRTSAPTRDKSQAPSPIPSGTANPKAPRWHSRRSNTQQDIRTNARHRPGTQPNPSGTANPKAHRRRSRRSSIWQDSRTHARQQPMHPAQAQAAQPTQKRTGGQSRRSSTQRDKRANVRLRALMSASGRTNPTQRESQGPDNPHPAAASRASGSNCGRRCTITYPA